MIVIEVARGAATDSFWRHRFFAGGDGCLGLDSRL